MEKQELFRIGDVAKMFHISISSLRHYEKIGLLQPEYIDPSTGYRYYSTRQFECLNTICYLRVLDMPLPCIADFLKNRDVDKMRDMLRRQKDEVIRREKELQIIERKIINRLNQLEDALSSELDTVRVIHTEECRVAWIRRDLSVRSYLDLETLIRELEEGENGAVVFLGKVGVGISEKLLKEKRYDSYNAVFLILDKEDRYQGETELLRGDTCVSIRFCGSHNEAPAYYEKLDKFISKNGFTITGFSREITMIDYGFTNDVSKFVTEIQIPVEICG